MNPELRGFLAALKPAGAPEGPVFPELSKIPVKGRNGLSRRFKSIMENAGVPQEAGAKGQTAAKQEPGSTRRHRVPERSFHSLRHTFTSWLANADVAPELRMKLTGHTTADVHAGYTHHELKTLADAVTRLPSLG
jgi:integrase